jgi:hypothetical protein
MEMGFLVGIFVVAKEILVVVHSESRINQSDWTAWNERKNEHNTDDV